MKTTNAVSGNPSPSQQKLGEENLRSGETLTIAGFALDGKDWDGIYVGRRKGGDLVYAGKVDHGFDKQSAADLATVSGH